MSHSLTKFKSHKNIFKMAKKLKNGSKAEILSLAQPSNMKRPKWAEEVQKHLEGPHKASVISKVLAKPEVIKNPKWPDLMRFLFSIQPTFEDVAEDAYDGHRVSKRDDEGWLVQGWDDGDYTDIKGILKIMSEREAFEHTEWEELFKTLLKRCKEISLEVGYKIINDVFGKTHVHKSKKWSSVAKIFEKYVGKNQDGLRFEWDDFKKALEQKKVKGTIPTLTLMDLFSWGIEHLKQYKQKSLDFRAIRSFNGIPPEVYGYRPLECLTFDRVGLHEISANIERLKNLKELTILSCPIQSIPQEIGALSKLTKLFISDTKIQSLPESIGDLKELRELILGDNKLTSLPESIVNLKRLEHLYIQGNPIKALPKAFSSLKSLKYVTAYKTLIPKEALVEIQKLLPNCIFYLKDS
jgi:hypothetical protein